MVIRWYNVTPRPNYWTWGFLFQNHKCRRKNMYNKVDTNMNFVDREKRNGKILARK